MANYHLYIYPVMQSVVFNSIFRTVLIYKKKLSLWYHVYIQVVHVSRL